MQTMQRTQISLEREQYELLTREAQRRGVSLSALLRELVDARFHKGVRRGSGAKDPLAGVIGIASGSGEAVGRNHNVFLYGGRKRR